MRYWVYINDKVEGPYEEDKLAGLDGFTPETLICSEEIEEGGSQEWVKASNIFEFDEAGKTMTRAPLTQEELDTVRGNTSDINTAPPSQTVAPDNSVTQILIDKIDYLTREIESLKTKLDAALTAAHTAVQTPVSSPEPTPAAQPSEPVTEEALITNTESLVNHAEQLVAQAGANVAANDKPVDFLDEIQIDVPKADNPAEKGGEEVVLRSALDSLYNAKPQEQTETEKEATFQDLLSPLKTAGTAAAIGAAAGLAAAATDKQETDKKEQTQPLQQQEPAMPQPLPAAAPEPITEPVSEEKREEIINEITAPAQQNNLILQAVEEAQKEEQPQAELASVDSVPQTISEPQPAAENTAKEDLQLQMPSAETNVTDVPQSPAEKEALDLADQPQLNIAEDEPANKEQAQQPEQPQQQEQEALSAAPVSDQLTPMNPSDEPEPAQKVVTETIKELVPGKKIEAERQEEDGIISQADLDEAFTERAPAPEFPIPAEEKKPADINEEAEIETPQQAQETLPEGKGFYNPNDMTEVELKEGSTYLISDFIPPAVASSNAPAVSKNGIPKEYGAVPGSAEAAQAGAEGPSVQVQPVAEAVEEIIPAKKADQADLTMSKVILENTIKTKRGATMDIKTVPMVQEPAESERLDLSDSDLDINTQHDIKAADIKPGNNKLTKMVLGSVAGVVILVLIYVMLAYLELLPAQFNFIKSAPAAQDTLQDEQLNEVLPQTNETTVQPSVPVQPDQGMIPAQPQGYPQAGYGQPQGTLPQQPLQQGMTQPQAQQFPGQLPAAQPGVNPLDPILTEVKNLAMANGQTLEQLINSRHPAAQGMIEWSITTAVEPNNYSILVKVPPENPQSFKISHRFNYNTVTKVLSPTISDSKNLLDSITPQAVR